MILEIVLYGAIAIVMLVIWHILISELQVKK